jgi:hypothetical protein
MRSRHDLVVFLGSRNELELAIELLDRLAARKG